MRRTGTAVLLVVALVLALFALPAVAVAGADGGSEDLHAQVLARAGDAPATAATATQRLREVPHRLALLMMAAVVGIVLVATGRPGALGLLVSASDRPSTSVVDRSPASRRGPPRAA